MDAKRANYDFTIKVMMLGESSKEMLKPVSRCGKIINRYTFC